MDDTNAFFQPALGVLPETSAEPATVASVPRDGVTSQPLGALSKRLSEVNRTTAERFMALAAALQASAQMAREITALSRRATGAELNDETGRAITLLHGLVQKAGEMSASLTSCTSRFSEIQSQLAAARPQLEKLVKMRALLHVVGVLSRIEANRIDNTLIDLSSLSKDIDGLADDVERHMNEILSKSQALRERLTAALKQLSSLSGEQSTQIAQMRQDTQAVLAPMLERSQAAAAAANEINDQYRNIQAETAKIVMGLQVEDIARQRMEHVQTALNKVDEQLHAGVAVETCAPILALQRAQMESTRDTIDEAVEKIESGLRALGPRVSELVTRTRQLSEQTRGDSSAFAGTLASRAQDIYAVCDDSQALERKTGEIVHGMVEALEQMMHGANAIEEIGASVHLVSMNAAIKTAHLGREGVAMGVIAEELGKINRNNRGDIEQVGQTLRSIRQALSQVATGESATDDTQQREEGKTLHQTLDGLAQSIRTSSDQMQTDLSTVESTVKRLSSELGRGCELARQARTIRDLFDTHIANFDHTVEQIGFRPEMAAHKADSDEAESLAELYTMESERRLHSQYSAQASVALSNDSEFGDDVELF